MNLPDTRGWVAIGAFCLFLFELVLMALLPDLAKTDLFKWALQSTWQGGTMLVIAFYFVASKSGADKDATIAKQLDKQP